MGLVDDCPPFSCVYDYVAMVAGASLTAAKALCEGKCRVALNEEGGRHRTIFRVDLYLVFR